MVITLTSYFVDPRSNPGEVNLVIIVRKISPKFKPLRLVQVLSKYQYEDFPYSELMLFEYTCGYFILKISMV